MRAIEPSDASEEAPIEFSRVHRIALLATARLMIVLVALLALSRLFLSNGVLTLVVLVGLCVLLLVGLISTVPVIHAVLILAGAPDRRVRRNIVATVIGIGSLLLVLYLVSGALRFYLPQ